MMHTPTVTDLQIKILILMALKNAKFGKAEGMKLGTLMVMMIRNFAAQ